MLPFSGPRWKVGCVVSGGLGAAPILCPRADRGGRRAAICGDYPRRQKLLKASISIPSGAVHKELLMDAACRHCLPLAPETCNMNADSGNSPARYSGVCCICLASVPLHACASACVPLQSLACNCVSMPASACPCPHWHCVCVLPLCACVRARVQVRACQCARAVRVCCCVCGSVCMPLLVEAEAGCMLRCA